MDSGNHRVQKFTQSGDFLMQFGELGDVDDPFGLRRPRGIDVDLGGNVYMCDTGNNAVKVYKPR